MTATEVWDDKDYRGVSRILGLPAPQSANEPARLVDLQTAIEGLAWKDSVRVATQANLNLASPGATIDGITMATGDRVLVKAQTTASANGIYIWTGAASAMTRALDGSTADELENAVVPVDEGSDGGKTFRQSAVNFALGTDSVTWSSFGTAAPAASETASGIAEIATQAETDAGTDDLRFITPAKLANAASTQKTVNQAIGDGSATQFDITHGWGTFNVLVQVRRTSSPGDTIDATVTRPTNNTVRVNFAAGNVPTTNQFTVMVQKN